MTKKQLHQVVNTMLVGDATSDHVLLIRRWLRELGFESEIYSPEWEDAFAGEVHLFDADRLRDEAAVVFHHNLGSDVLDELKSLGVPLILIYHNITPPQFFGDIDFVLTQQLLRGRRQLADIQPQTRLALSDSPYSEQELTELAFAETGVLPIVLDEAQYAMDVDQELMTVCKAAGPLLLFVGRIVPNKRQEDLIKLLYYYRRIEPNARLVLVGGIQSEEYLDWLQKLAAQCELSEAVTFTGRVTQQEMVTYYRAADLYVSMSEHEGFGKPLIESMYLQLPVLAYASTAVPSTMGDAGILFTEKDYEALAEVADLMIKDSEMRRLVVAKQDERVRAFLEPAVQQQWRAYLRRLKLL